MQVRYGGPEEPTVWPYGVINDYGTGYAGAYGVLLALLSRSQTNKGQHIQSGLARTACTLQSMQLQDYAGKTWDESEDADRMGSGKLHRLYECSDGWIFVGAKAGGELARVCGFDSEANIVSELNTWCEQRSAHQAVETLGAGGIGAHALVWMNDVVESDLVSGRGLSVAREHERLGMMRTSGPAQWFSSSQTQAGRPAPLPGSDAESILGDIGRTGDLAGLTSRGVIRVPVSRGPRS